MWKTAAGALAGLCLLVGQAAGEQSLAEVAKKERERRARLAKGEPRSVVGEKELESARGDSLSISGREAPEAEAAPPTTEAPPEAEGRKLSERKIRDLRQEWNRIWHEQMAQAKEELSKARDDVYQCRAASRYVYVPIGVDCEGAPMRLAVAEARLREVESSRYHWENLLPGEPDSR